MKIKRQELLTSLEIVKPGLANREVIEQSTHFAFVEGRVVTYNDEISISHPVAGLGITGTIPADPLYQLLSKFKDEEVDLELKKSEVLLTVKTEKTGLPFSPEVKLPLEELKGATNWKPVPPTLTEALQFCMFSCSRDMSKPVLTCIHICQDGTVESCDNHRITRYQVGKLPIKTFLLPATSSQRIIKPEIVSIAEGKGWIHFKTKSETVYSCRVYSENYPDTTKFFDVEGKEIKLPKSLPDLLEKAEVFSEREFLLDQRVDITLKDNKMKITSRGALGWYEGEVNVKYKEQPIQFSIHPQFLREIVGKVQTCIIGERVMKFEGENWKHVVSLSATEGK